MAITKPTRNMLSTGVSDSSDSTFLTADSSENATFAGNLIVTGNLTVSGTQTVVSSTVETHADPLIELNTGAGSNSNDLGFVFERGSTGDNAALIWDESADVFVVGTTTATGTSTGNMSITATGFTAAAITGTTGTFSGEVSAGTLDIGGTNITSTAAEINLLDALDRGSILYGNASGVTTVLGQGSADQVLTSDGTDIAWADASGTTINGNTNNYVVTGTGTANTLQGESGLLFVDGRNLGLGVTPEASTSNDNNGIYIGGLGAVWGKTTAAAAKKTVLSNNVYDHPSTGEAAIVTDEGAKIVLNNGTIQLTTTSAATTADAAHSWNHGLNMKSNGSVGINIVSPDYKFQVNGTGTTMNDGTGACIMVNTLDNSTSMIMLGCAADPNAAGIGYSRGASRLWMTAGGGSESNSTAAFCLNGAGQVGIGKIPETEWDSAWKVLQVGAGAMAATTDYSQMSWSQNGKARGASSNSSWERIETGAATQYVHDAGSHYFKRAASASADAAITWQEQVNIKSNGIFEVIGKDGGETHQFQFHNNGAGDGTSTNCSLSVQGGNTLIQLMAWASNGCRIGSRGGGWSGTATDVYHTAADATYLVGKSNGTAYLANGSTAVTSDQRLKKNITDMADGQLAKINALTVRNFEWKDARKTGTQTGLIAQEVESVISDAIEETAFAPDDNDTSRDFDGDVKIVKYGDVQMRLLKAVQELSQDVTNRNQEISDLEQRIHDIEQRLI